MASNMKREKERKSRYLSRDINQKTFSYAISLSLGDISKSPSEASDDSSENMNPNSRIPSPDTKDLSAKVCSSLDSPSTKVGEEIIRKIMVGSKPSPAILQKTKIPMSRRISSLNTPSTKEELNSSRGSPALPVENLSASMNESMTTNASDIILMKVKDDINAAASRYQSPISVKQISPYKTNLSLIHNIKSKLSPRSALAIESESSEKLKTNKIDEEYNENYNFYFFIAVVLTALTSLLVVTTFCRTSSFFQPDINSLPIYQPHQESYATIRMLIHPFKRLSNGCQELTSYLVKQVNKNVHATFELYSDNAEKLKNQITGTSYQVQRDILLYSTEYPQYIVASSYSVASTMNEYFEKNIEQLHCAFREVLGDFNSIAQRKCRDAALVVVYSCVQVSEAKNRLRVLTNKLVSRFKGVNLYYQAHSLYVYGQAYTIQSFLSAHAVSSDYINLFQEIVTKSSEGMSVMMKGQQLDVWRDKIIQVSHSIYHHISAIVAFDFRSLMPTESRKLSAVLSERFKTVRLRSTPFSTPLNLESIIDMTTYPLFDPENRAKPSTVKSEVIREVAHQEHASELQIEVDDYHHEDQAVNANGSDLIMYSASNMSIEQKLPEENEPSGPSQVLSKHHVGLSSTESGEESLWSNELKDMRDTQIVTLSSSWITFVAMAVWAVVGAAVILRYATADQPESFEENDVLDHTNEKNKEDSVRNDTYFDIMSVVDSDNMIPQSVPRHKAKAASRRRLISNLETPLRRSRRVRRSLSVNLDNE
jgi:hypothetical protein